MTDLRSVGDERKTPHLDDDAFSELTMGGAPTEDTRAHLKSCERCREELARFTDAVSGFNMASLAWSEDRSGGLAPLRPRVGPPAGNKVAASRLHPALAWGLAVLLAVGVAIPLKVHFDGVQRVANGAEEDSAGLNSPEQIAKDNQLLADVNYELNRSGAALLSQYDRQRGSVRNALGERSR